jgi:hypothetical protein
VQEWVTSASLSGKTPRTLFLGQTMKRNSVPVVWMSVAFCVALALATSVLAVMGTDAKSISVALRLTARWTFLLFWMAYAGRAMSELFGPALAPLGRRGREFGLAFAAAHLVHIGLVVWLYQISTSPPLSGSLFVFFTIGIVWTYLLATLSFGGLSKALGPVGWRLVRILGLNYILLAFARDFVFSVVHSGVAHEGVWHFVAYVPFAAMSVIAPLLSFAAAAHRRWAMRQVAA